MDNQTHQLHQSHSDVASLRQQLETEREAAATSFSSKLPTAEMEEAAAPAALMEEAAASLKGDLSLSTGDRSGPKSERDAMYFRLIELETEKDNWETDKAFLVGKVESLKEQLADEIRALKSERDGLQIALEQEVRTSSALVTGLQEAANVRMREQEQAAAGLVDHIAVLQSTTERQAVEITEKQAREAALVSELDASTKLVLELQRQVQEFQGAAEQSSVRAAAAEAAAKQPSARTAAAAAAALSDSNAMVSELRQQMANLEVAHKEKLSGLQLGWERRTSNLKAEAEQRLSDLQRRAERQKTVLASSLAEARQRIERLQGRIGTKTDEEASVVAALEAARREVGQQNSALEELR